jgi:hypothetical protein
MGGDPFLVGCLKEIPGKEDIGGLGRRVRFGQPIPFETLVAQIKSYLGLQIGESDSKKKCLSVPTRIQSKLVFPQAILVSSKVLPFVLARGVQCLKT